MLQCATRKAICSSIHIMFQKCQCRQSIAVFPRARIWVYVHTECSTIAVHIQNVEVFPRARLCLYRVFHECQCIQSVAVLQRASIYTVVQDCQCRRSFAVWLRARMCVYVYTECSTTTINIQSVTESSNSAMSKIILVCAICFVCAIIRLCVFVYIYIYNSTSRGDSVRVLLQGEY
jgi:hypothetical protein